jgi:hypothetical protein
MDIQQGQFVEVRGRPWLVEAVDDREPDLMTLRLSCIADDAQGEQIEVLWDAEIGARIIQDDTWSQVGRGAPDSPEVLAAYLRAIRWRSATAADRDLLQAPFRAGIRLDAYQLLPLRKALRLPRVNLLIADDVGLGKTVEAGLVVRELLLRRRIDLIVISPPPAMIVQWKDELESKFGSLLRHHRSRARRRAAAPARVLRQSVDHRLALPYRTQPTDRRNLCGGAARRAPAWTFSMQNRCHRAIH